MTANKSKIEEETEDDTMTSEEAATKAKEDEIKCLKQLKSDNTYTFDPNLVYVITRLLNTNIFKYNNPHCN